MTLRLGKWRGLQQTTTRQGTFCVLAIDHRNNLRQAVNPADPDAVPAEELIRLKCEIVAALAPVCSAVLIDPELGGAQCLAEGAIPGHVGLIMALEATGYTGDPTQRESRILAGWSIEKARRMSASGVKLLVYYHPDAPNAAKQEQLVEQVGEACARLDVAFFLEPLSYSLDPARKKLSSQERRQVVIETAQRLVPLGVDVLKAEFPVDVAEESDERLWQAACAELTTVCPVPWLLLSAAVDYETYLKQVRVACEAGASGVMAGRAVWQEAVGLQGQTRQQFLTTTAHKRMLRLRALCDALGRPLDAVVERPIPALDWYLNYPEA